jgi:hypothetical protein
MLKRDEEKEPPRERGVSQPPRGMASNLQQALCQTGRPLRGLVEAPGNLSGFLAEETDKERIFSDLISSTDFLPVQNLESDEISFEQGDSGRVSSRVPDGALHIMSWNVLLHSATKHAPGGKESTEHLLQRIKNFQRKIILSRPDVLLLQEWDERSFVLPRGYRVAAGGKSDKTAVVVREGFSFWGGRVDFGTSYAGTTKSISYAWVGFKWGDWEEPILCISTHLPRSQDPGFLSILARLEIISRSSHWAVLGVDMNMSTTALIGQISPFPSLKRFFANSPFSHEKTAYVWGALPSLIWRYCDNIFLKGCVVKEKTASSLSQFPVGPDGPGNSASDHMSLSVKVTFTEEIDAQEEADPSLNPSARGVLGFWGDDERPLRTIFGVFFE